MKRFICTIVLFLLSVVGGLMIISALYMQTQNTRYAMHREDVLHYREMPERIDAAIFGNSHPNCAFRVKGIDQRNLFRFCYDGQQLFGDAALYHAYADRIAPGGMVIFSVSDFSLEEDWEDAYGADFLRHYLTILPFDDYPMAKMKWLRLFRAVDFDTRDVIAWIGEAINPEFCLIKEGYGEDSYLESVEPSSEAFDPHLLHGVQPEKMEPINQEKLELLEGLVKDAQDRGLRPVLLMTPCYKTYFQELDLAQAKKTIVAVEQMCKERQVPFLNYFTDERFIHQAEYFRDEGHLNQAGAEYFTPIAIGEMDAWYGQMEGQS